MNVPINELENIVDETILKRGLSYFKSGHIKDFNQISDNEFEFTVLGRKIYTVNLKIENNVVVDYYCNCPYDMGPVCKHIVAAIYYFKQNRLEANQKNISKKTKPINQQINEILEKVSFDDIKEFILKQSRIDKKFRNIFISNFAYLDVNKSKEFYKKQISNIIDSTIDENGGINYDNKYIEQAIKPIVKILKQEFKKENWETVFHISSSLMEELYNLTEIVYDSDWVFTEIIDEAYWMLLDITSKEDITEELRKEIFYFCITAFEKQIFKDLDWHFDMLELAYFICNNEQEGDIIIRCIDNISGKWEREKAQSIKLSVMTLYKNKEEVDKFIEDNINNSDIRTNEIKKAVERKDYKRAIKLCKDGIEYDKKLKPGLVKGWYSWLLKIAQLQQDIPKIIEYARFLYIFTSGDKDYYSILKENIESKKWNDFLEKLIVDIRAKSRDKYPQHIVKIFVQEKWWDRLLLMLKEKGSLHNIENYEKYLSKEYSKELISLYAKNIIKYIANNKGRSHYKLVCNYIRRMIKLGGNEEANKLIEYIRKKYPRRKALLEELGYIKL